MQYTVVIEKSPRNFAAYVPDLPGCVATGVTREEVIRQIRQAIAFHIESLRQQDEVVPEPQSTAAVVDVATACTRSGVCWKSLPRMKGTRLR